MTGHEAGLVLYLVLSLLAVSLPPCLGERPLLQRYGFNSTELIQQGTAVDRSHDAFLGQASKTGQRNAYVMMAFDAPGAPPAGGLWNVLAMAHAIRSLSSYPLVVLTNTTNFPDGSPVGERLRNLNVQVLPVRQVLLTEALRHERRKMPCQFQHPPVCEYHFLKLQIWSLTQFDKLIWMDNDAIITRSSDHLFQLSGTWAQQDNWDCGASALSWMAPRPGPGSLQLTRAVDWLGRKTSLLSSEVEQQSHQVCSGLVVLTPSEDTYQGLIKHMAGLSNAPGGDQQIIEDYFGGEAHAPVKLLSPREASFGQCLNRSMPGHEVPTFVHKSDRTNTCFHLGANSSKCRRHPLGTYWHDHFCKGVRAAGISGERLESFCASWT